MCVSLSLCVCVVFCAYAALMRANKPETVSAELVVTVCSSLLLMLKCFINFVCVCVCVVCVCTDTPYLWCMCVCLHRYSISVMYVCVCVSIIIIIPCVYYNTNIMNVCIIIMNVGMYDLINILLYLLFVCACVCVRVCVLCV